MFLTIANVLHVLIAIAMIVLILLQRGAGAAAGSGFGGGASATVFGARGSANFLSKSTAVLATLFFVLSLGMAMYASRMSNAGPSSDDLGVMGGLAAPSEVPAAESVAPPAGSEVPSTPPTESAAPSAMPTAEPAVESVEPEVPPRG